MNNKKRMISILMIVCCLVLSCSFAVSATEGVPRVTFTNAEKNSPDLYVTKQVINASEDYPAPEDDTFTFRLKLNGSYVDEMEYILLDASGKPMNNTSGGVKVPFTTDDNGTFTLKAGQTAVFESVGSGKSYEVEELPQEDYIQTQPAGGLPAVGTIEPKGSLVEFENLYTPSGTDVTAETMTFVVSNSISFPKGYTPWEAPDFHFTIKVDGEAYAGRSYTVTATDGSEETFTTDDNGGFTLKGGQTATFLEMPANADYEVVEAKPEEGWRITSKAQQTGATKAPITYVYFTNVSASFAVKKTMEDSTHSNEEFEFILTKKDGSEWKAAKYYLYDSSGKLAAGEQPFETGDKGEFHLKAEQTAIFIGIAEGEEYGVKESELEGYEQVTPSAKTGYTGKKVVNSVEMLHFVNKMTVSRALTVTKQVENMTSYTLPGNDAFTFRLLHSTDGGKGTEAVPYAEYVIEAEEGDGIKQYTYQADENGEFTIYADDTAVFNSLSQGIYTVEEVKWPDTYTPKGDKSQTDILPYDGEVNFTFTNRYWHVPPTGIQKLPLVWKILIGVACAALAVFAAVIVVKRRRRRLAKH